MDNLTDDPATSRPVPSSDGNKKPRAMDESGTIGKQFTGTLRPRCGLKLPLLTLGMFGALIWRRGGCCWRHGKQDWRALQQGGRHWKAVHDGRKCWRERTKPHGRDKGGDEAIGQVGSVEFEMQHKQISP